MKKVSDETIHWQGKTARIAEVQPVLSRRQILATLGSAATYLGFQPLLRAAEHGSSSFSSGPFQACSPAPVPIPGGFNAKDAFGPRFPDRFFHLFLPGPGLEPSTIFNFKGKVAIQSIHGTGTRTDLDPISGQPLSQTPSLPFATDLRFFDGTYVGVDDEQHQGTFAFF
jgi:hypothetical protein